MLFSHRPEREWQNKQLVRQDYAKSRRAADVLYRHSREAVDQSGLPVLEVNDDRQRGDRFGTRLANAFADAFAQGYDYVIAVGSDCPRLHEVDWSRVADRLAQGTPVLGPTPGRDGTYLIGLSRAQFDRASFARLPWQSPALLSALDRYLAVEQAAAPVWLTPRDDVNGHRDLVSLVGARSVRAAALVSTLREVLGPSAHTNWRTPLRSARVATPSRSRAPPSPRPVVSSHRPLHALAA